MSNTDYQKFFKYINFFVAYILSFVLMYKTNLELLGIGISFIINTIAQLFLFIDVSASPKSKEIIVLIIIVGILATFISNVMVTITLKNIHGVYSNNNLPIRFEKEDRKIFDIYKILYITIVMCIGVSSLFLFSLYKTDSDHNIYAPYFNFNIDLSDINTSPFYILLQLIMSGIKVLFALAILGIGGGMLYLATLLSRIDVSNIYIPTEQTEPPNKSIFEHRSPAFSMVYDIYRNLNLNYIIQGRHSINL